MDFTQLEYFIVIANMEHISKAAEVLNISQPALSTKIQKLEEELGVQLFERKGRNIELNEAGHIFREAIQPAIEHVKYAKRVMLDYSHKIQNTVVFAAPPFVSFPGLMESIEEAVPGIEPRNNYCEYSDVYSELANGHIDFCMSGMDIFGPGIERAVLCSSEMVVCAADTHPLAARNSVTIDELEEYPFATYSNITAVGIGIKQLCMEVGLTPNITFTGTSMSEIMWKASQGKHVVMLPYRMATQFTLPNIKIIHLADADLHEHFCLYWYNKKIKSRNHFAVRDAVLKYFNVALAPNPAKKQSERSDAL